MKKFANGDRLQLRKLLLDKDKSIEDIATEMEFSVPVIMQKLTEIAVERLKYGDDYDTVIEETRAIPDDIRLLQNYQSPEVIRVKELVKELLPLLEKI